MMEDIYKEKVNCVIVKDLSRFGRDYIEAGRFIQKTFPAFQVRFIAVTDYYDSLKANQADSTLVLPVKNFVNDSYCRDISMKVRAHQRVKRLEGKCLAAFPVYGYLKDPQDKNRLVVDGCAADVVKQIFAWKVAGMSLGAIAKKLNGLGILSPAEYKKSLGMKYETGFERGETGKWAAMSVKRILTNRVYAGDMEQGKREKISYKMQKRTVKPESEWIRVKNTHEAMISELEFDMVQELLKYDGRASQNTKTADFFSGILLCADCGAPMVRRSSFGKEKKKFYYICQTKNKSQGCSRHRIEEENLQKILQKEIKFWLKVLVSHREVLGFLDKKKAEEKPKPMFQGQLELVRKEYRKYEGLKNNLCIDFREGLLEAEEFEEFQGVFHHKCRELELAISSQENRMEEMDRKDVEAKARVACYKENADLGVFTRELLVTMVRKIRVHEGKELDIEFRFSGRR